MLEFGLAAARHTHGRCWKPVHAIEDQVPVIEFDAPSIAPCFYDESLAADLLVLGMLFDVQGEDADATFPGARGHEPEAERSNIAGAKFDGPDSSADLSNRSVPRPSPDR